MRHNWTESESKAPALVVHWAKTVEKMNLGLGLAGSRRLTDIATTELRMQPSQVS